MPYPLVVYIKGGDKQHGFKQNLTLEVETKDLDFKPG